MQSSCQFLLLRGKDDRHREKNLIKQKSRKFVPLFLWQKFAPSIPSYLVMGIIYEQTEGKEFSHNVLHRRWSRQEESKRDTASWYNRSKDGNISFLQKAVNVRGMLNVQGMLNVRGMLNVQRMFLHRIPRKEQRKSTIRPTGNPRQEMIQGMKVSR